MNANTIGYQDGYDAAHDALDEYFGRADAGLEPIDLVYPLAKGVPAHIFPGNAKAREQYAEGFGGAWHDVVVNHR